MKAKHDCQIAIVGATGLVGGKLLEVLYERNFPLDKVRLAASERSVGAVKNLKGHPFEVKSIQSVLDSRPDVALFSAGGEVAKEWAPAFKDAGICVIDNSSAWRLNPEVPLIVPEINGSALTKDDLLIANPNCSTIQLVMALAPLHQHFGIQRVVISTYQSVTGSGQKAVDQLFAERKGEKNSQSAYPHPIDMNCLPHCDDFQDNGYTKEEMKMVNESRKILEDANLPIAPTAVRVPVTGGHSESLNVELKARASLDRIKTILGNMEGIQIMDDPVNKEYPMPLNAHEKDEVLVGRIREDHSQANAWNMWIVADNLRKGAATNAVQILEYLVKNQLIQKSEVKDGGQ